MHANAIVLEGPGRIALESVALEDPGEGDLVVEVERSSISTGTERLLWEGRMPHFPGMGYPLVPGYETVGTVVDAGREVRGRIGERVFVPGTRRYRDVRPLFGGAASLIVTPAERAHALGELDAEDGTLLALAATAWRAVARNCVSLPELVVGHGVLGRLAARIVIAMGAPAPLAWETDPDRRGGSRGYDVVDPAVSQVRDLRCVLDASGDASIVDRVTPLLARRGEIVLAGFYEKPIGFAFAPAFMREAAIRISAEFEAADVAGVLKLVNAGRLSLAGLVTHRARPGDAAQAYATAFGDRACLKMALDWRNSQ